MRVQQVRLDAGEYAPQMQDADTVVQRLPWDSRFQLVNRHTLDRHRIGRDEVHVVTTVDKIRQPALGVNVSADGEIGDSHYNGSGGSPRPK